MAKLSFITAVLMLSMIAVRPAAGQCRAYDISLMEAVSKLKEVRFDADKCEGFLKSTIKKETLNNDRAYSLMAKDAAEAAMDAVDVAEDELLAAQREAVNCNCEEGNKAVASFKRMLDDIHDRYEKIYNVARKAHYAETAEESAGLAQTALPQLDEALKETGKAIKAITAGVRSCD